MPAIALGNQITHAVLKAFAKQNTKEDGERKSELAGAAST